MKRTFAAALVTGLSFASADAELININFEQFTPSPPYAFEDPATMEGPAGGLGTTWNQYDDDDSSGIVLDSGNNPTTVTVTTNFSEGRPGSGSNLTV